jgi:hypothetical protein
MKYLILALLAATFSLASTAEAGVTIHCNGDPTKDLNLHKSGSGGKGGPLCADGGSERIKNSGHATEKPGVEGGKNDGAAERDKLKGSTKSNTSDRSTTVNGTKSNSY